MKYPLYRFRIGFAIRSDFRYRTERNGEQQLLLCPNCLQHTQLRIIEFVQIVHKPYPVNRITRAEQQRVHPDLQIQTTDSEPVRCDARQNDDRKSAEQQQYIKRAVRADEPAFRL